MSIVLFNFIHSTRLVSGLKAHPYGLWNLPKMRGKNTLKSLPKRPLSRNGLHLNNALRWAWRRLRGVLAGMRTPDKQHKSDSIPTIASLQRCGYQLFPGVPAVGDINKKLGLFWICLSNKTDTVWWASNSFPRKLHIDIFNISCPDHPRRLQLITIIPSVNT